MSYVDSCTLHTHLKSTIDPEVKGKVEKQFVKVNLFLQLLISILRLDKLPLEPN